ncbi:PAS domain-containing protein [Pseudohoeflea coraliihabitans]|uniref:PAS domain-containing protein n=1 Tax=Pseudohoeflea coraliihabitans TaxID=2860393 RepID=A0ABS6WKV0_9HYPH|nr:PAS domain-containing protein [Pseudohoeflea sp. DP4N28-3]MBW3095729.1 PAS domain-containing protein [Pseudohoeflea sp. DP4N28-3]
MIARLIGRFNDENLRLKEAIEGENTREISELDDKISRLVDEIFSYSAARRSDINRQISFFSRMIELHQDDPGGSGRYSAMQVRLFNRYLSRASNAGHAVLRDTHDGNDLSLQELLLSSLSEQIAVIGHDNTLIYCNDAFARFHGAAAGALIGVHSAELVGEECFIRALEPALQACLSGKRTRYEFSCSGCDSWREGLRYRLTALRGPDGNVAGAILMDGGH